jgi:sodium transport system permease protein
MNAIVVVLQKELRDALRDKRSLMSLFIFPVIGPLMIFFLFNTILDSVEEAQDLVLPVVGVSHAPDLIDYLRQNGVTIEEVEPAGTEVFSEEQYKAVERSIAARSHNFVLLVPNDFTQQVADNVPVNLELHYDSSRQNENAKVGRVQALLEGWGRETASLRLMARGISAGVMRPVNVARIDVAGEQARAQSILGMIPMFVLMAAFMSGVGIAVDATAGERERKSLEPLLVNPVSRSYLVVGKWLAATVFSVVGLVLVMSLNLFAMSRVPLEELGISFIVGTREITGMLLVAVPLGFFATALQIFIGLFARSFKDAQVYTGLMMLLPIVPFYYNLANDTGRQFWMNFVPLLGQNMLLTDVVSGRTPAMTDFVLAACSLALWAALFIALATHLIKRERLLFA